MSATEAGDFPILFVAQDENYNFSQAPHRVIGEHNAEFLTKPGRLVRSLKHHGGLRIFKGDGDVFISYARRDGADVAEAVRSGLIEAEIGVTVDVHAFPGGTRIQREIRERIERSDLVILVNTPGAHASRWVREEIDIAQAAHVQVLSVCTAGPVNYPVGFPQVILAPGEDPKGPVLREVRRLLARRSAFLARVGRILDRVGRLCSWRVSRPARHWQIVGKKIVVDVEGTDQHPTAEHVHDMLERMGTDARGVLVAGVRPLSRRTRAPLLLAGKSRVQVTHLAATASHIPAAADLPLTGVRVFLSASMPSAAEDRKLADRTLGSFIVSVTQAVVQLGGTLVFGGHPSITPLVHEAVDEIVTDTTGTVELHQARVWRDSVDLPPHVREGFLFDDDHVRWHGQAQNDFPTNIGTLRDGMITDDLHAGVFVGGKTAGWFGEAEGKPPGIVDEYQRFRRDCPTGQTYVLHLAGGAAATLPRGDRRLDRYLATAGDPDVAVALIVADLLGLSG